MIKTYRKQRDLFSELLELKDTQKKIQKLTELVDTKNILKKKGIFNLYFELEENSEYFILTEPHKIYDLFFFFTREGWRTFFRELDLAKIHSFELKDFIIKFLRKNEKNRKLLETHSIEDPIKYAITYFHTDESFRLCRLTPFITKFSFFEKCLFLIPLRIYHDIFKSKEEIVNLKFYINTFYKKHCFIKKLDFSQIDSFDLNLRYFFSKKYFLFLWEKFIDYFLGPHYRVRFEPIIWFEGDFWFLNGVKFLLKKETFKKLKKLKFPKNINVDFHCMQKNHNALNVVLQHDEYYQIFLEKYKELDTEEKYRNKGILENSFSNMSFYTKTL